MLTPKKKISRREIKQDPLIGAYERTQVYYYENKKMIGYAITGLIALVVLILVYTNNRRANEEKAAAELGKVFSLYDAAASNPSQYKLAIEGQPERGIMGLKAIVDNYGSTASGGLARFYLATAYYNLGQFNDALKYFDDFSTGSDLLTAARYAGMGGCYEARGEYAKAASEYDKASSTAPDPAQIADYLNAAAHCYGRSGDKEKAVNLYKRLKREYPSSEYARDADRYIGQFSA